MTVEERLAELCHAQWSGWMDHVFSKGHWEGKTFVIDKAHAAGWTRQKSMPYAELSEPEKELDREEARRFLHCLSVTLEERGALDNLALALMRTARMYKDPRRSNAKGIQIGKLLERLAHMVRSAEGKTPREVTDDVMAAVRTHISNTHA